MQFIRILFKLIVFESRIIACLNILTSSFSSFCVVLNNDWLSDWLLLLLLFYKFFNFVHWNKVLADQQQVILRQLLEEPVNQDDNSATIKAKHFYKSCVDIRKCYGWFFRFEIMKMEFIEFDFSSNSKCWRSTVERSLETLWWLASVGEKLEETKSKSRANDGHNARWIEWTFFGFNVSRTRR